MNNCASDRQRTGQPKWVQLVEKAVKLSALSRRSQAAVLAVTPAQGRGEDCRKGTATVSPILKESTLPTGRQTGGKVLKRGLKIKPIMGIPTTAVIKPARVKISLSKKLRREIFLA